MLCNVIVKINHRAILQESDAAVVSFAASARTYRRVESEYNEYIGMLEG